MIPPTYCTRKSHTNIRSTRTRRACSCSSRSAAARAPITGSRSVAISLMVSLAFRSGEDRATEDRMRALLRPRVHDVDDVHAAAVHARMSAKRRDAAGETQRAFAVVKKCLSRGEAAEEPGLGAIGIDDDMS